MPAPARRLSLDTWAVLLSLTLALLVRMGILKVVPGKESHMPETIAINHSTTAPASTNPLSLIPGILLLAAVGYAGKFIEQFIARYGKSHHLVLPNIEYVLWAILIGLIIANTIRRPRALPPRRRHLRVLAQDRHRLLGARFILGDIAKLGGIAPPPGFRRDRPRPRLHDLARHRLSTSSRSSSRSWPSAPPSAASPPSSPARAPSKPTRKTPPSPSPPSWPSAPSPSSPSPSSATRSTSATAPTASGPASP